MIPFATQDLTQVWQELQALVPISAIHNEQQYDRAIEALNALLDVVGDDEAHPLYDLLDTLGTLVHTYEEEHYPTPTVSGIDVIRFIMDQHQLNESDFPEIGSEEAVSELLAGKRELNLPEIRALADRFQISPASFI